MKSILFLVLLLLVSCMPDATTVPVPDPPPEKAPANNGSDQGTVSENPPIAQPPKSDPKTPYADLDDSGVIDQVDEQLFQQVLRGEIEAPTPEQQAETLRRMDLNLDENIDHLDLMMIREYLLGNITSFPIPQIRYGDLNLDGQVTQRDVDMLKDLIDDPTKYNAGNRLAADVNEDERFTGHDVQILRNYLMETFTELPLKKKIVLGDMNFDQKLNSLDVALASDIFKKGDDFDFAEVRIPGDEFAVTQIMALDLNDNGLVGRNIDPFDESILFDFVQKKIETIPFRIYFGDLNADGKVNQTDLDEAESIFKKTKAALNDSQFLAMNVVNDFDDRGNEQEEMRVNILDLEMLKAAVKAKDDYFKDGQLTCRYGDYNYDRMVDQKDLALMKTYLSGAALPENVCARIIVDINLDGSLGPEDEELLNKKVSNQLEGGLFPGEQEDSP